MLGRRRFQVGLDTRMANHTGIGTYLRGLLAGGVHHQGLEMGRFGQGLDAEVQFSAPIYSLQEQLQYPLHLARCDLWHAPHINAPVFIPPRTRLVTTVHDLIHWVWRRELGRPLQAAYARAILEQVVRRSSKIIAVSKFTKADILRHFDIAPERVEVIHEAAHDDFCPLGEEDLVGWRSELKARYHLPERYLLYVGLMKPHKNVEMLVRTWRRMREKGKCDWGLVLIGKGPDDGSETQRALEEASTADGFRHLDKIGWGELNAFYGCAEALVHPSRYEGFGLTVLEAMAAGTPVLTSNAASLPEVAGDAALFFDPQSTDELEAAIERLQGGGEQARLRLAGLERAQQFSWREAAAATAALYRRVLEV